MSRKDKQQLVTAFLVPVVLVIGSVAYATVFSSVYDTATPVGTDAPSTLDDQDRLTKSATQERSNVDHYWPLTGTQVSDADAGEHRKVLFHAPISATPTVAADHGDLRIKDVDGKAELVFTDEDEQETQITSAGSLLIQSSDILGILANDTYLTAVDQAGTGTVDLIKANASDVAVIPAGSELATSAAPTADAGIANKKYVDAVDDQVATKAVLHAGSTSPFSTSMLSANTFQDLDLSAIVGSNSALVHLEVNVGGATDHVYAAKTKGFGSPTFTEHWNQGEPTGGCVVQGENAIATYAQMTLMTDSSGVIQHGFTDNTTTITIKVLGWVSL